MSLESPEIQHKEDVVSKPKKSGVLKNVLAAGALAVAAGLGINEVHQNEVQREADEASAMLGKSHIESQEKEKEVKERYDYLLHNYHIRSSGKGTGYLRDKEYDLYVSNMNGDSPMTYMEQKARSLEIAIKSGIVDPEITGWSYLWDRIEFDGSKSAPDKIHFGNTIIPFNKDSYSLDELECFKFE